MRSTRIWLRPGIEGRDIDYGLRHIVPIGARNRDPRRFVWPDLFDPRRTDAGALSFGGGPHFCRSPLEWKIYLL
jgi:cytochrome P450